MDLTRAASFRAEVVRCVLGARPFVVRAGAARAVAFLVLPLTIFLGTDLATSHALTRPEISPVAVPAFALFGLAVIIVIGVLARRALTRA